MMRTTLFSLLLFISLSVSAQRNTLTEQATISVITVGPGTSLNDAFGHSAFRVNDPEFGIDLVFNYGVYDFQAPNFYLKFAQGKLNYMMGLNYYSDFYDAYTRQDRTIDEQVLNLTASERQQLFDFLRENYKPENRYYLYDFFYDNCATRMRDVVQKVLKPEIKYRNPAGFEPKSFRQLIHDHVPRNSWGAFGIDLALGSLIDREASSYEYMFLPKYIHDFFGAAKIEDGRELVSESKRIYTEKNEKGKVNFFLSPLFLLGLVALLLLYLTYSDYKRGRRSRWLDGLLFFITGLAGLIIFMLWFATDHGTTAFNYNLLWAFPLNLLFMGLVVKKEPKKWIRKYYKFLVVILFLMCLHWLIGVQIYALGLIPILIALMIRYSYVITYLETDS